jgi:tellurium resistance protein TerD
MSTRWSPARRADLSFDKTDLPGQTFFITNRDWYDLFRFLRALNVQGLETLAGDGVLVPTNLAHHWGNAILSADLDRWFQLGVFNGEAVVPAGIVHESEATKYLNTCELVPLAGSVLGDWLTGVGQELAMASTGLVINSRRSFRVTVELEKRGSKVDLTKLANQTDAQGNLVPPSLVVGLSWNARKTTGEPYDLDASVVCLNDSDKSINDKYFVFYNNPSSPDGAIRHLKGDSRDGSGEGDDEQIAIDTAKLPDTVRRIDVIVTIDQAKERKQSFAEVSNVLARIFDPNTNENLVIAKLTDEADETSTAARVAQLYRTDDGGWHVKKFGDFYDNGLKGLVDAYEI